MLRDNFDAAYNGNKAPLPVYIDTAWLSENENRRGLVEFIGGRGGPALGWVDGLGCAWPQPGAAGMLQCQAAGLQAP